MLLSTEFFVHYAYAILFFWVLVEQLGMPIGPYDVLIAGQALARDLTLVTHNTREFQRIPGLRIVDWQ